MVDNAVKKAAKVKSVDDFFRDKPDDLRALFDDFNSKVLSIDSVITYTRTQCIVYKVKYIFVELGILKNKIRVLVRTNGEPHHSSKIRTEKVPDTHGWGKLNCLFYISPDEINRNYTMNDIMLLVKQAYKVAV